MVAESGSDTDIKLVEETYCSLILRTDSANFDLLTTSPSCTLRITEAKALPTLHSMPGDVPAGNSNINLRAWLDFHVFGEFRHAFAKILRPLTSNVVCDKNPRQHNADKGGEDNVVHVTVSETKKSILTMV